MKTSVSVQYGNGASLLHLCLANPANLLIVGNKLSRSSTRSLVELQGILNHRLGNHAHRHARYEQHWGGKQAVCV